MKNGKRIGKYGYDKMKRKLNNVNVFIVMSNKGKNPVVIGYNPSHCVLSCNFENHFVAKYKIEWIEGNKLGNIIDKRFKKSNSIIKMILKKCKLGGKK